jgi:UDP-N-acetylmuramoyl-L-alanyl-D-glutamate--2,6-diaminopimelate ligase
MFMQFIKKLIPASLLKLIRPVYHGLLAQIANVWFGRPSEKMVVIGVTGTAGKSTTAALISWLLNKNGLKSGYITTVNFFDGNGDYINKHGLSMPGGFLLNKQLKAMEHNGCKYAIVECTSEGLAQNRHLGINFDIAIFTNISPAHIEAHGGFEQYKQAKGKLFQTINNSPVPSTASRGGRLTIHKKAVNPNLQKTIIANLDDSNAGFFLSFPAEQKFGVTLNNNSGKVNKVYNAVALEKGFELEGHTFNINLVGGFNFYNALIATACANILGINLEKCKEALADFKEVHGRMQLIENNKGFKIFVDYGCEPVSIKSALDAVNNLPHRQIIHVFGSTGGHRDKSKRELFGRISAERAHKIIVTNDDVYDSDPGEIAKNIEAGILAAKSSRLKSYGIVLDRNAAIKKALSLAGAGDIVLITGKGSEQFLVLPGNKRVEWEDAEEVRQELRSMN